MGYIYKITNKITKQSYIGQTIIDLHERWRQHCKPNSNCRYLKSAIKKYGIVLFEFKLIISFIIKIIDGISFISTTLSAIIL